MREIKFRMLNKGININTGKQEWDYKELPYECFDDNFTLYVSDTLSQFTGLFDKNGVEIYEGDIVERNNLNSIPKIRACRSIVEWCEITDNEQGYISGIGYELLDTHNVEVIGNIYENKELLNDNL